MRDQRGPYLMSLRDSGWPRTYWSGTDPEDSSVFWLFETVEDDDKEFVALRHIEVTPSSTRGYSVDHLEDDFGFLAVGAVEPRAWGWERLESEAFELTWVRAENLPRQGEQDKEA